MNTFRSIVELCISIVQGNIWIGTAFWIGLGIAFAMLLAGAWNALQETNSRTGKAFIFGFWALLLLELLVVIALSFVEIG